MIIPVDMKLCPIVEKDRKWLKDELSREWGSPRIISRGRIHEADLLPGFVAIESRNKAGFIIYEVSGRQCEIVALKSLREKAGIGTALINKVIEMAKESNCLRVWLVATNDNLKAIEFYLKRGFRIANVYPGAIAAYRKLKPQIPDKGYGGIHITDEIEMELDISG